MSPAGCHFLLLRTGPLSSVPSGIRGRCSHFQGLDMILGRSSTHFVPFSRFLMSRLSRTVKRTMKDFLSNLLKEAIFVSLSLFRVMIPVVIFVKIFVELGGVKILAWCVGPAMKLIGLPAETALVWATSMLTTLSGGLLVLVDVSRNQPLSVEQMSILATLLLFSHSLPVEVRVAQKAGLRVGVSLVLRILGGFLLAWILHVFYSRFNLLQQPSDFTWSTLSHDESLAGWLKSQALALMLIQAMILGLLFLLKLLKLAGIERLMIVILRPILEMLGIRREAASLTIVGVTLGLSYGGGLLMNETRKGHLSKRDIFSSLSLLCLCHSIFDDSIMMLLAGADVSAVIWARVVFSFLAIAILTRCCRLLPDSVWDKYLVNIDEGEPEGCKLFDDGHSATPKSD